MAARKRATTRSLVRRAAECGMDVSPELRAEMRDILAGIARDPDASKRERKSAALGIMAAHKTEMEALRVAMEVEAFAALKAELAELREIVDAGNSGTIPGAGPVEEGSPRSPAG